MVIVIETHNVDGVEWGISFNGYNPEEEDYFPMTDKDTAFRISDRLNR